MVNIGGRATTMASASGVLGHDKPIFCGIMDKEGYNGRNREEKDNDSGEDGLNGGETRQSFDRLGGARARHGHMEALGGNGLVWGDVSSDDDKRHGGEEDGCGVTQ